MIEGRAGGGAVAKASTPEAAGDGREASRERSEHAGGGGGAVAKASLAVEPALAKSAVRRHGLITTRGATRNWNSVPSDPNEAMGSSTIRRGGFGFLLPSFNARHRRRFPDLTVAQAPGAVVTQRGMSSFVSRAQVRSPPAAADQFEFNSTSTC